MADISLLFDVATGGNPSGDSEALIRSQLEGIVSNINSNPFSIKFQADEESLKQFQKRVSEVALTLGTNMSASSTGFTQVARQIDLTAAALHTMNSAVNATNLDKISSALSDMSGVSVSVGAISDIISRLESMSVTLTDARVQFEDLGKTGERIPKLIIEGVDAAGNSIRRSLRFDNKGELERDLTDIAIKLAGIDKQSKTTGSSTGAAGEQATDKFAQAKKAVTDYYNALTQLSRLKLMGTAIDQDKDTGQWVASKEGYDERVAQLNRLQQAYDAAITSSKNFTTSELEAFNEHKTDRAEKYRIAVEDITNAEKKRQETLRSVVTITRSYDETINRCEKNLRDWSAAEHSRHESSRTAYKAFAEEIEATKKSRMAYQNHAITLEEYTAQVDKLKSSHIDTKKILQDNGDAAKTFGERISGLAKKFTQWLGVSQIIMYIYRSIRQMISAVKDLDTAMTELKKVTNETDATYERFLNNAATRAKKLGASLVDTVNTTADFARLGLTLEEAEVVSDAALVYKNVGDGITDIDQASQSIISTMQAFGIEVNDVMSIVDKFNTAGNNFAISSGGVGDALLNSASALAAANNTLDESIALITAANETIQDPEKVGTALKTLSMYIRAAKTEAEEAGISTDGMADSVSELREEILSLTSNRVDIMINDDEFKSTYQIIKELSEVWGTLTETTQANITELIGGGVRNANVISALMTNMSTAGEVIAKTSASAGSALAENEKVLDSIQGKINIFKATFQEFSSNFISTGLVTTIIDIATGILSFLNGLQKVHALLPTLIALFAMAKGIGLAKQVSITTQALVGNKAATEALIISVQKMTNAQKKHLVANIQAAVTAKTLTADEAAQILTTLSLATAEGTLTIANKGLAASFKSVMASIPVWGWIALGISVVIEAISLFTSNVTSSVDEVKNLEDELNNIANTATETANKFRDLKASAEEIIPRFVELAQGVNQYGENMGDLSEDEYAEFLKLNNQLAEMFPELNLGMDDNGNAMLALSYSADTLSQSLWDLVDAQREAAYTTIAEGMADELDTIAELEKKYNKEIDKLEDIKDEWTDVYNDILNQSLPTDVGRYSTQEAGYQAALDFIEKAQRLGMHGDVLMDNQQTTNNGYVFSVKWDYTNIDIGAIKKLYNAEIANQDKLIHNYENKIAAAWNKLNPIVSAWMNTDFIFNDLDSTMQEIALTMASGLNFSELGLKTEEDVKKYITEHILDPLFLAGDDVKEAFANITDWKTQLANGEITAEEFSSKVKAAFNGLIGSMDADEVDTFKTAFVTGMNAMGIEGNTFDEVVTNLINDWSNFDSKVSGSGSTFDSTKKSVNAFKTELEGVQKIIASQEPGKSLSIDDYNAEGMEDYRDALEYTNGAMQLNAEKVREITEAKAEEQKQTIATNKALAQDQYLKNAKQIEEYRNKLAEANDEGDETEESVRASIAALLDENSALADTCKQYDLLSTSISEATSAYSHWLNAQSASDYGDMADDAVSAIEKIRNTYDSDSEDYSNFGSKKFAAAVDFIVPDTVDQDDIAAVEAYMNSFQKYLTLDDDGNVSGLNVDQFLSKAVEAGLMSYSADDGFQILGVKKMEDFAEGLNMSSGMVTAFFDELQLKGAEFDWGDEGVKTFGDLAVEANEAAEALRLVESNKDLKIKLDISDLETTEEQVKALDTTIASMNTIKGRVNVSAEEVEYANSVIQYCITQKQLLTQPDVMRVDTSQCEGDVANVVKLLQDFQTAQNNLEIQQTLGMDTTEAQSSVDRLYADIQALSPKVKTELGLDTTSIKALQTSLYGVTAEVLVTYGVNDEAVNGYNPESKTCDVIYNPKTDLLPQSFDDISVSVCYNPDTDDLPTYFKTITRYVNYVAIGDSNVNGTAHAGGTAAVGGDWGTAHGGHTLVGELGREIVVDPRTGRWYTVGDHGAEFVNIPPGAIVFNHKQTESLLNYGYVSGRASALVNGTAMVTGGYKPYKPVVGNSGDSSGNRISNTGSSTSVAQNSTSNTNSTKDEESEFERLYKYHQHLLEMDAESTTDYLKWLNTAYKKAYKNNEIELEDYYKYEEEVYQGRQELFKDHLNDVEHEISMRENYDGESKNIISIYKNLIKDVEDEIDAAREQGLDDTDDYIQELQSKWKDYHKNIKQIKEDAKEDAKDALDELVKYRIDMIKQDLNNEKDALEKKLDNLKDFYDKQKESIQDKRDEDKYLKEQTEKRKSVSAIQEQLAMLGNDDSAWAQKRKLELEEELSKSKEELNDFEDDHAYDMIIDALDKSYEEQEAAIDREIAAIDEKLNNPNALYNQALSDIKNNTGDLYKEMLEYNRKHGSGNDEDVKEIYNAAYDAFKSYEEIFGKKYKGVELPNSTGKKNNTNSIDDSPIFKPNSDKSEKSSKSTSKKSKSTPKLTESIKKNVAAAIWNGSYGWGTGDDRKKKLTEVFGSKNGIQDLVNKGVGKNAKAPNKKYSYLKMRKKFKGYASGTKSAAPGIHSIDELGAEYLFTSSDGNRYRVFSGGEKVLNAKATDFIYEFANGGGEILEKIIKSAFDANMFDKLCPVVNHNEVNIGDIIVQGSADLKTVSEIRRAQRDNLTEMLKSLNKLNK